MSIDIKEVVDNLKCVKEMELNKWSVTHMEYAIKAIEQLQSEIEELKRKVNWYISNGCGNQITSHNNITLFAEWMDINCVRHEKQKWTYKADGFKKVYTTNEMYCCYIKSHKGHQAENDNVQ